MRRFGFLLLIGFLGFLCFRDWRTSDTPPEQAREDRRNARWRQAAPTVVADGRERDGADSKARVGVAPVVVVRDRVDTNRAAVTLPSGRRAESRGETRGEFAGGARGEPSIGTIRVLGHRGCDSNTLGWFLSVGTPEQYDFSVSEDGETLEVQANTPQPSGNFEFVRCADSDSIDKHVRFTAQIQAEGVTQTARLRLRGEDREKVKIVHGETEVKGTYDWKDFAVETDVTSEVVQFSYGMTFKSAGKLRLRHPKFEIVGPVGG